MDGGALSVRSGNGIEVSGAALNFHLDPRSLSTKKLLPGAVCCTSHAHSDHIPSTFERKGPNRLVASEFTRRFISEIKGREILAEDCPKVRLHDAGHVTGSVMFEMDLGGQNVLYTGDFSPRDRFRIKGARPVKVDVLLTESTFGRPQYIFPPTDRIFKVMTDWIEDSLSQGFSVALFTSSNLGKTHELIHALRDLEPTVHGTISEGSRVLQRCGLDLEIREHEPGDVSKPGVLIGAHGQSMTQEIMIAHRKGRRFRKASVSGWAVHGTRRGYVDEHFAISDHADHDELLEFVRACSPRLVYVQHGYASEFAAEVQQKLGIDACPVPSAGQQCLLSY